MTIYPCPIPKIEDQRHSAWEQPRHAEIQFTSDGYAVVSLAGMEMLHEYSHTYPTGCYAGRMWKKFDGNEWWLCWLQDSPKDSSACEVKQRRILTKEVFELLNPGGKDNQ